VGSKIVIQIHGRDRERERERKREREREREGGRKWKPVRTNRYGREEKALKMVATCFFISYLFKTTLSSSGYITLNE
jgi:hypothetical protein